MGGEVHDRLLSVHWVEMLKDEHDPRPPDGLGWHPVGTWLATYDVVTLTRLGFEPAANRGVRPIYGYAVASDARHTYLFGNTFEQNLTREGGYWNGPHSATRMYLARIPRGRWHGTMEYRTARGWSRDPAAAVPIVRRHWAELPMQPRFLRGRWIAVSAVNGYWGETYEIDVAAHPWGPWTTVQSGPLLPRASDPRRNTYHAHLAPWQDAAGDLVVTVSNNARDMRRDAWPDPSMYRPTAFAAPWVPAPPAPVATSPTSTVPRRRPATTTTTIPTTVPATTVPTTTVPTTTVPSTTAPATTATAPTTTPAPTTTTAPTTSETAGSGPGDAVE